MHVDKLYCNALHFGNKPTDYEANALTQGFLNFLSRAPLDTNPRNSRLT